jgi:TonB family protein
MDVLISHTPKGFLRVIGYSFALHVIVIAVALVLFKAGPRRVFFTPVYTVNLVDPATVRRRTRRQAKPKVIKKAAPVKKAPPAEVKAKAPVKKKKAAADTLKTSQLAPEKVKKKVSIEESLKKIEASVRKEEDQALLASRIEELKKKEAAKAEEVKESLEDIRKNLAEAARKPPPAPAGAPVGSGPAGPRQAITASNLEIEYPAYLSAIRDSVQDNWIYPETFKSGKFSVIVSVKIGRDGGLLDVWVEQSSGLRRFDESLVNAVRKAEPFPPVPGEFEGAIFETGLRFCPECTE